MCSKVYFVQKILIITGYLFIPVIFFTFFDLNIFSKNLFLYICCFYIFIIIVTGINSNYKITSFHSTIFFLFLFFLSFIRGDFIKDYYIENFVDFIKFIIAPPENYISTTDINEFLFSLLSMSPFVYFIFYILYFLLNKFINKIILK